MAVRKKVASKKVAKKKASKKKAPAKKAAPRSSKASRPKTAKKAVKKAPKKTPKKAVKKVASKAAAKRPATARKAAPTKRTSQAAVDGPGHGFEPYKQKRGESYMDERMHAHFRDILVAWKQELMEEVDRTVHHMKDEAANFPDPNDRATQESEFSLELRARDRERKLIKKIDESTASIESDEYGYCESCGVDIGVRRLEARPTATLCIDCKTLDEIRERQRKG
jgi:RNA polymerase-binding transcription factor